MPKYCCIYGCSSSGYEVNRSFYPFPRSESLKKQWTSRIRRADWSPSSSSVVCDLHFAESDFKSPISKSDTPVEFRRKRPLANDAVPSLNLRGQIEAQVKPRTSRSSKKAMEPLASVGQSSFASNWTDIPSTSDVLTDEMNRELESDAKDKEIATLKAELDDATRKLYTLSQNYAEMKINNFSEQSMPDDVLQMYTGLERKAFNILCKHIEKFQPISYYTGKRVTSISLKDQLLLCLIKLKQNPTDMDLAFRFEISRKTAHNIFITFLNVLYEFLYLAIMSKKIPTVEQNKCSLPSSFENFSSCRMTIDCTEIKIHVPRSNLDAFAHTYSNYKSNYTTKFLIGVAPNGTITYVSEAYPGNTSDKAITSSCGVLDVFNPGDLILADKGFTIHDIIPQGIHLNLPPFLSGKRKMQFSKEESIYTRNIARARIHVERANQRFKTFRILDSFPAHYRPLATKIVRVACCLVNLQSPLIANVIPDF